VALLPPQALSWHAVGLPKLAKGMSQAKLQAVLVGLLEEQLLDEPADVHLSLHTLAGQQWAAACHKAWLHEQIKTLQAAGVQLSAIRALAMPSDLPFVHVSGNTDQALITLADSQGVVQLPLAYSAVLPAVLDNASYTAEPAVAAAAEQATGWRFDVSQAAQQALLGAQRAQAAGVDLAQGEFALAGAGRGMQRLGHTLSGMLAAPQWRPWRWGVVALVAAQILGLNAWAWQQKRELSAKRAQMQQILSTTFPQVKVIVDAPVQMQRELTSLRQAQGQLASRDFESMLGRFSAAASLPTPPSAMDYVAGELSLKGTGLQAAQMEQLSGKLQASGLQVRSDAQQLLLTDSASGIGSSGAKK
jgi:general secretion pathway protein L